MNILYVEDHPRTARAVRNLLESEGHSVRCAYTLREAREHACEQIDVLVCELRLPDGDGAQLVAELRRRNPDLRAIALSPRANPMELQKGILAGFDEHLTKPVELLGLLETLYGAQFWNCAAGVATENGSYRGGF